ncbi:LOW QUALITY PROTEIN: E3 SUMO-protein ligase ZBED1 [Drosophila ananassae]|uniref:LOW QUALITY PROTEIN: E3 SUMO-protein ligase ZBED1 n=1 Tax=Drosophila ananassae TaxID=7217 RepID=UPI0013A5F255|nr:LOW QUALITY PROTEIN: E3 SUMO-protein ligase ZBED1 [Drosophila ananassae]
MSKKSNVWQFFYKASDTVATCGLCQRNYSRKGRGTTCLRNHLKSRHPAEFMTLSENIKYVVKREIGSSPSQHPTANLELKLNEPDPDPLETGHGNFGDTEDLLINARCDEKLALCMFLNQSFDLINGNGFISFVRTLQPRYVIHPKIYYEKILCQDIHRRIHSQIKQQVDLLDAISLSTSLWWGGQGEGLLSLSCSGITRDFRFNSFMLRCEAINFENAIKVSRSIRDLIPTLTIELPKDKIFCVVRDEFSAPPGSLPDCSAHRLQMCVRFALQSNEVLMNLSSKCKQIVDHFAASKMAHDHLKFIQEMRLKRDPCSILNTASSKWNSSFRMMGRLLRMKDAITLYADENSLIQVYPDEWIDIDLCLKVMQPCEEIMKIWSTPSTSASSVIPLVAALRDSLRTDVHNYVSSVTICSFARKLLEELEMKFSHITSDIKFLMATYLDPRYKQAFFTEREEQMVANEVLLQLSRVQDDRDGQPLMKISKVSSSASLKNESKIDSILDTMLTNGTTNTQQATTSFGSQSQIKNLLYLYNSEPRIGREMDPLLWWKTNAKYSAMFPIVRRFLSVPAASIASEGLFKESSNVYNDMQTVLSRENASKILLIKSNFNMFISRD